MDSENQVQYKPEDWYHWGRWIERVLFTSPWLAFKETEVYKKLGLKEVNFISDIKDLDGNYFFLRKDLNKVSEFSEDKLVNEKEWFDRLFSICDQKADEMLALENKKDINKFLSQMVECLACGMVIEFADQGIQRYLQKLSLQEGLPASELMNKMRPHKKTLLMQYQTDIKSLKKEDIPKFLKEYEWIGTHGFEGTPLNEKKINEELSTMSKPDEKEQEIDIPEKYKEIIDIGSKLAFYRSNNVETVDKVGYSYWPVIKELAKENDLTWNDILCLTYEELINFNNNKILPDNYQERLKGFGIINANNKIEIVVGDELKKELESCQEKIDTKDITELKGMVTYKSKALVRGKVKVVEGKKSLSKVNEGEILVANETTPDYVQAMKRASAIITNQGGITSHAAIISRELKTPCIIGTKIATKVLKDGDLVELDTEKGIVKILEKGK